MDRHGGAIRFKGEALDRVRTCDMVTRGIVHVPEGRHLFPEMSVRENLELGAYRRRDRAGRARNLERVFALFPRLRERGQQRAGTLSGGEQQMVAVGRGLMAEPELLLLDEPSQGLAPVVVDELFRVIRRVNEAGIAVLLVEQNARRTLRLAHRGYVRENGRIALAGSTATLLADDMVRRTYLGL